jgi:hypothetical protein
MRIEAVHPDHFQLVWPLVEGFISSALEYSHGEYTTEQAKVYLSAGTWVLYVAVDDAGALHGAGAVVFNNDRTAFVVAIGGKMFTSQDTWQQFVSLLKLRGATQVEGAARESIARLWKRYGFEEKYRIVSVRI